MLGYAGLFALAFAARIFWLDRLPLWNDELFSVLWSRFSLSFLVGQGTGIETNPPLHFILLKGWIALFGDSAFSVRLPSVLASSAAVIVGYATGRQLLSPRAALLGGILLAIAPLSVALAQEGRAYAFVEFTASVVLLAATRFVLPFVSPKPIGDTNDPLRSALGWAALFAAASAASFLFHYTVLFLVFSCIGVVGLRLLLERPVPRSALLIWIGASGVTAVLIAIPLIAAMSISHSGNLEWIGKPTPVNVLRFVMAVLIGEAPFRGKSTVVLAVLAIAGWGWSRRYRPLSPQLWLLVAIPVIAASALVMVSLTRSLIVPRYAAWLLTPVLLAVAAGMDALPRRVWTRGLFSIVVIGSASALAAQFRTREKEDWRSLAAILEHEPACRGPLAFDQDSPPLGLAYYDPSLLRRPLWRLHRKPPLQTAEHYLLKRFGKDADLPAGSLRRFMASQAGAVFIVRAVRTGTGDFATLDSRIGRYSLHRDLGGGLQLWCS